MEAMGWLILTRCRRGSGGNCDCEPEGRATSDIQRPRKI